jgi:exodeoxyribonuclease VII large subunit
VLVWPVLVQGQGSAEQVAAALRGFAAIDGAGPIPRPDLLIVARGGGSIEDLWGFNEEIVVRAIAESPIPVISAVGHETDTTLADHAADRRAPTPTAAAEIAVPVLRELAATLAELGLRQRKCALRPVTLGHERLEARLLRMPRPESVVALKAQALDDLGERLRRGLADRAARARDQLQHDRHRLSGALLRANARRAGERLAALDRLRRSLNPRAPLERGYALVSAPGHAVVASRALAAAQAALTLEFADGRLEVAPGGAAQRKPRPAALEKRSAQNDLFD